MLPASRHGGLTNPGPRVFAEALLNDIESDRAIVAFHSPPMVANCLPFLLVGAVIYCSIYFIRTARIWARPRVQGKVE